MCPRLAAIVLVLLLAASCAGGSTGTSDDHASAATAGDAAGATDAASDDPAEQRYPDIVDVEISSAGGGSFDLAVTVSSPYDTPERYADGWRVLAPDGAELGTHTLLHDHAGEQPFTRTQTGVAIPAEVDEVTVEGRDQQYGFGGETITVDVPHEVG